MANDKRPARDQVTISIDPALREKLELIAKEERRTLSAQMCHFLAAAVAGRPTAAPAAGAPVRTPPATLDDAEAKLAELKAERGRLSKRNGPPGPRAVLVDGQVCTTVGLSLEEQERLRWPHNEVLNLQGDIRLFERQEQA